MKVPVIADTYRVPVNAQLETRDGESVLPSHWAAKGTGYEINTELRTGCTLRDSLVKEVMDNSYAATRNY